MSDTTNRDQLAEHLHTVEIIGTTDAPQIKFTCHGDRDAPCHRYPACDCEFWNHDHEEEYGHPDVAHDECWMQPWFDDDNADPNSETLIDCDYVPGMSGPVRACFQEEYVAWEFIIEEATDAE
ncbi:hypothetical protein [Nocardia cyriacigeorgica]|jgi:hypothetical protein|uniref:hypothetical protein n=1 Tax=Nocardia cyriacigeorgica TaxID=135487 RepID=UPI002456EB6A|nr:hypothetical protein [Nocardia cyriacigeorgica]